MQVEIAARGRAPLRVRLDGQGCKEISLGSAATCEMVLSGSGVAPLHAQIVLDRGGVWLCALQPVSLDGREISGWTALQDQTSLEIGGVGLQVSARADTGRGAAPDDRYAALAAHFALPPDEVEAIPTTPRLPFLKQKFLDITVGVWIVMSSCAVVALVGFTTRSMPLARASRARDSQPAIAPVLAAAQRPQPAVRPPTAREIHAAAEALFARDDARALQLYRDLAARDPRYRPFVRALELKQRKP